MLLGGTFFSLHGLYPLYIDPGTGSMLFSIAIGAAATVYFLFRAFMIKAKVFFAGTGNTLTARNNKYVIYAEDKRYWTLFKPILDEFEGRKTELLYLTSSEDDPVFSSGYNYIKSEYIGSGNRAFARLNFLSADFVLMTTPGLDVYQMKRSKTVRHYSHILHSAADATMYRIFGLDYFDSVLCTGDYQKAGIRALEKRWGLPEKQLVTVGCAYMDESAKTIPVLSGGPAREFTVLVSPSWGQSALLARYGEKLLDPLIKTGFRVLIRPHPQSKISEAGVIERLTGAYKDRSNVEWDYLPENTTALARADIMISDFSGVMFDYMFLFDKPVIFVNFELDLRLYDAHFLPDHELWQIRTLKEAAIELRPEQFDSIGEIIKNAAGSPRLKEACKNAKEAAWMYRGEAGKRTAEFMFDMVAGGGGAWPLRTAAERIGETRCHDGNTVQHGHISPGSDNRNILYFCVSPVFQGSCRGCYRGKHDCKRIDAAPLFYGGKAAASGTGGSKIA